MNSKALTKGFFILILLAVTLAFFGILSPYYSAILWAAVLAIIFHPLKSKIRQKLNDRNGVASLLTVAIIFLIVFIPLGGIVSSLVVEINGVYTRLQDNNTQFPVVVADMLQHLPGWARHFLAEHGLDNAAKIQQALSQVALRGGQYLAGSVLLIGKGTFTFFIGFGVMLYLLFFLLKEGSYLVNLILESLPLSTHVKHHLLVKFAAVSRATVKGTVVVALVQGTLGGIAFSIAGIEGSLLWGALMAFLSLIPAVGSAIIWVPAAAYLFATNMIWQAIFIVAFFVLVVGLVDNILRPLLVGKDTKMPDYLILIATLGGMEIYGINGFVIGPLIAALFIACWNILSGRDNQDNIESIDEDFIEEGRLHANAVNAEGSGATVNQTAKSAEGNQEAEDKQEKC
ncbi:AI-2E family transporter [Pectobacterium cacticida]|uniref:AI-2E family transporter n=1 Tax=Pectobacterium cacticida TaxID=69221 RepID=A0ABZ2GCZ9_9GAMM|nr:AI-2E family transporter [Pectobacterium cacticida]UYX06710.1 AI-2E family transporter [Pectobacterium cacticida]